MINPISNLLRVADVAKRLNCSASTVYALIESGRLAHHRCPGVRVSEEQLENFLQSSKREQHRHVRQPSKTVPVSFAPAKHLDGERISEAWKSQGVR
jgi:excisionase family DNA binding protein